MVPFQNVMLISSESASPKEQLSLPRPFSPFSSSSSSLNERGLKFQLVSELVVFSKNSWARQDLPF